MDMEDIKLYWQLLPKLPLIATAAIQHIFHLSEQSQYLDLQTEVAIAVIRAFLTPSKPNSISATQRTVNRDPGIKGRIWVSKYTSPSDSSTGIRDSVRSAVQGMRDTNAPPLKDVIWPESAPVEAEWHGYRAGATKSSKPPTISNQATYDEMMKETSSPVTVLYLHGGAYFLMDPATHRSSTKKIAQLTGGRCYSVRYRLAPQHAFPAALMDALQSYLTLLYPPPGAYHEAVRPEAVIVSGDSAGGNLSMALIQLLLQFQRQKITVSWLGIQRAVPIPAGVALSSPWLDMTHSSTSCQSNAAYDYLPDVRSSASLPRPSCAAWPASPPRKLIYCADSFITHPLVTLILAKSWEGCPPVYMSTGWELLADEDKYMAVKLHSDGVPIVFEEYEAMPHVFALVFPHLDASKRCLEVLSSFARDCVENGAAGIETGFKSIKAKTLKDVDLAVEALSPYTEAELKSRIRALAAKAQASADDKAGNRDADRTKTDSQEDDTTAQQVVDEPTAEEQLKADDAKAHASSRASAKAIADELGGPEEGTVAAKL